MRKIRKILFAYDRGLVNLIAAQNPITGAERVNQLRELAQVRYVGNVEIALLYVEDLAWLCANERSEEIVTQECQGFYADWQADPEAVRRMVSAEPDGNMKTLKLFLLEHTELFPEFMEWLVS